MVVPTVFENGFTVVRDNSQAAVKRIREKLGLSQYQLAGLVFKSHSTISAYESGEITIPPGVAYRLIEIARLHNLRLKWDHIYGGEPLPDFVVPIQVGEPQLLPQLKV